LRWYKYRTKEKLDDVFVADAVLVPKGNAFNSRWSFRPAVMVEKIPDAEGIEFTRMTRKLGY